VTEHELAIHHYLRYLSNLQLTMISKAVHRCSMLNTQLLPSHSFTLGQFAPQLPLAACFPKSAHLGHKTMF